MSERRTLSFSGDEIIQAMIPEMRRKLGQDGRFYVVVATRWNPRALPPKDAALPAGHVPMTVDVEFVLERAAEKEPS